MVRNRQKHARPLSCFNYLRTLLIKEVVQEIVLSALSRAGFFKHTAFCDGTALRIFYGLDRFSEDLDFSLKALDASEAWTPRRRSIIP
ncbi:MAG: nucleotidyl transferase AbiEii/AbiGii toxin family protein [Clostridiales bacterium]|nr:nucleotidyl transferase AbiEii/AbiGii toxin family protein [Clostridiales bacterium]